MSEVTLILSAFLLFHRYFPLLSSLAGLWNRFVGYSNSHSLFFWQSSSNDALGIFLDAFFYARFLPTHGSVCVCSSKKQLFLFISFLFVATQGIHTQKIGSMNPLMPGLLLFFFVFSLLTATVLSSKNLLHTGATTTQTQIHVLMSQQRVPQSRSFVTLEYH